MKDLQYMKQKTQMFNATLYGFKVYIVSNNNNQAKMKDKRHWDHGDYLCVVGNLFILHPTSPSRTQNLRLSQKSPSTHLRF